jgi:hypothetical protein
MKTERTVVKHHIMVAKACGREKLSPHGCREEKHIERGWEQGTLQRHNPETYSIQPGSTS